MVQMYDFCQKRPIILAYFFALSAKFAHLAQLRLVDNLDLTTVNEYKFFTHKRSQSTYGIGSGHIGEIGQILTRHINTYGHPVLLKTVVLTQHYQSLGQTAAYMLLGKINYACIGASEVAAKLMDKKPCHLPIFVNQLLYNLHGY